MGEAIGVIGILVIFLTIGAGIGGDIEESRSYRHKEVCPTLIEQAPDTLALIQEFPKCLPYVEGET